MRIIYIALSFVCGIAVGILGDDLAGEVNVQKRAHTCADNP